MGLYEIKMRLKRNPVVKKSLYKRREKQLKMEEQYKREALKRDGDELVKAVEDTLEKNGFEFFINFGNLLGLIREQKFMEHDNDVDYGVVLRTEQDWDRLEKALSESGFKKIKQFYFRDSIAEQTYKYKNLTVDFLNCFFDSDHSYSYMFYRKEDFIYHSINEFHVVLLKMYRFVNIKKVSIGDKTYHIPENAEAYLASVYGENWRIPDPNWTGGGPSRNEIIGETAYVEYIK